MRSRLRRCRSNYATCAKTMRRSFSKGRSAYRITRPKRGSAILRCACSSLEQGALLQEVGIEVHAEAMTGGDGNRPVPDLEIRRVPRFLLGFGARHVFHVRTDVGRGGGELKDIH